MTDRTCSIEDCEKAARTRGWCDKHYMRWHKYGDPLFLVPYVNRDHERFWAKVNKDGPLPELRPDLGPCWVWTGASTVGYGAFRLGRQRVTVGAHRWAYEETIGPIPDGLHLDHVCRRPICVNVENGHLEPVTPAENIRRGESSSARAARTGICVNGHSMEDAYEWKHGRRCRVCAREDAKVRYGSPASVANRAAVPVKYRRMTPERKAEVFSLRDLGLSHKEIAERVGCAPSTVSLTLRDKGDVHDGPLR